MGNTSCPRESSPVIRRGMQMGYNIDVNLLAAYELKRLDTDYFIEE
jgi:hypothetical protein